MRDKSPLLHMATLDKAGADYSLRNIVTITGANMKQADVLSFGGEWLELRVNDAAPFWLQIAHIVSFAIVEGE